MADTIAKINIQVWNIKKGGLTLSQRVKSGQFF